MEGNTRTFCVTVMIIRTKHNKGSGPVAIFKAKIVSGGYRWASLTCFAGHPGTRAGRNLFLRGNLLPG
jgi:hypothetical protein